MTRTNIGTANVENGVAETTYTIPSDTQVGSRTLYATYQENDDYMLAEAYNTFEIRIPTQITIDDVLGSIGETITLTAHVNYNTNQNVDEGTVQFQVDGRNEGAPQNVSNGVATLQYTIPDNTSDGTAIKAIFIETGSYGASTSADGTLSIRKSTNVVVENISANRDSTATITALITDGDGANVGSGQAQLYIDNTMNGEPVAVAGGTATFSYNVANNAVVGGHTIKVAYLKNDELKLDPGEGTGTLTVRTPTILTAVNVSGNKGATVPITINVKDENTSAIPEGTVNITVGAGQAIAANVSASGVATINYDIPDNATGTISFSAVYVENTNYQGSTMAVDGVITVRKGTTIVVDSVKAELGDTITLSSTIMDENNETVGLGTVNYEIE